MKAGFETWSLRMTVYISTPFPYCYGLPHMGNLVQAIKSEIHRSFINSFYKSGFINQKVEFSYSFHCTGLPLTNRLNEFKKEYEETGTVNLSNYNLSSLSPYIKNYGDISVLSKWVQILSEYYTDCFKKLKIKSSLPSYHTTTSIDEGYSKFVNFLYNELNKRNKLVRKKHYLITCDKCKNVMGDHDRKRFEGRGISQIKVRFNEYNNCKFYYLKDDCEFYITGNLIFGALLLKELKKLNKETNIVFFDEKCEKLDFKKLTPWEGLCKEEFSERTLYYTIREIECKCGGYAIIEHMDTWFVKFSDPQWKEKTHEKIKNSFNTNSIKNDLLKSSKNLRDVSFLRNKGFGTTLDIIKSNEVVDSLMDSPIHPLYYSYMNHSIWDLKTPEKDTFLVHCTGRDLIPTHLLYFCYFLTQLYPNLELPFFDTTRYIVSSDNQKMSKSLGNVIHLEDLEGLSMYLKHYVCTLADTSEPTPLNMEIIKSIGISGEKHKKEIISLLDHSICEQSYKKIIELLQQIANNSNITKYLTQKGRKYFNLTNSNPEFKIRKAYNLIFNQLRNLLKKRGGLQLPDELKILIKNLVDLD